MGWVSTGLLIGTALLGVMSPATAQTPIAPASAEQDSQAQFSRFIPHPTGVRTQMDYSFWDEALEFMVLRMGLSTREGSRRPDATLGTRRVYGHESRVRMEGNRIVYSFLDDEQIAPLSEYRRDLERLGSELDITSLPRDEQLAYWMNLHNVAVVEQIASNYPIQAPSRMKLGPEKTPLDTTRFITVAGVAMSPRDIRTRIVFPNWTDPNVIYGFHRGDVGGPSIQRRAFTASNLIELLGVSAKEYVNSLRGVEGYGDKLLVSAIYAEAAPFYFPDMSEDLKRHLASLAEPKVASLIASKSNVEVNQYEETVADLAAGDREPIYNIVTRDGLAQSIRLRPSVARFMSERAEKMEQLRREGLLQGRVIVLPPPTSTIPEQAEEKAKDE